jgi:hypothetical protein
MILNEGTPFAKGTVGNIEVTDFDALSLLSPSLYPITPALHEATIAQADAIIQADRDDITERYAEEKNQFIDSWLIENRQYVQALKIGVRHRIFERLQLRSEFSRFVKDGTITDRTRHALFTYRPDYYTSQDKEPLFSYDISLAPDLEVFYHGLKRHHLEYLGSVAMKDMFFPDHYPEEDWEYQRINQSIDMLRDVQQINGMPAELPEVTMPIPPKDTPAANYLRNWSEALFVR